jgi:uncharacterized protein YdhG (YjbR/CyaY superfamily)
MQYKANTPEDYISQLPEDRKEAITKLRDAIRTNLPEGFEETIGYGMIGYVVPHSIYPKGYHANPKLPLPFMNIASQKNFIAVYHMGLYAEKNLMDWFKNEYPKHTKAKLDMGKSCIRFKKPEHIPYELFGELASRVSVRVWIDHYENLINKMRNKD